MATTVYEVQELTLDDGSTVTCKPANIKVLRKGNELIANLGNTEDTDDGIQKLLDIVFLCLKRQKPELANEDGTPNYDLMEELFDMDTVFKVIEIYLGIKLNDPKLLEAAARAVLDQTETSQDGKTSTSQA